MGSSYISYTSWMATSCQRTKRPCGLTPRDEPNRRELPRQAIQLSEQCRSEEAQSPVRLDARKAGSRLTLQENVQMHRRWAEARERSLRQPEVVESANTRAHRSTRLSLVC